MPHQARTLSDLQILEYGQLVSAPHCARIMASLGAEVIKIEPPTGDAARRQGPYPGDIPHPEKSGLYLCMNLGKLGVTLDPATTAGGQIFRQLIGHADILVENNPPGYMESLGLGYESLRETNPDLILVSITPLGQRGPYKDLKAYDLNLWHAGGWGYLWRERASGEEPGRPIRAPAYMAAFQASYNALAAALGALYHRDSGGRGQHIDVSEQEALAFIMAGAFPIYNEEKRILGRSVAIPNSVPSGPMPCKDGYVLLSAVEPHQVKGLADMLGNPDWTREEWMREIESRRLNWDIIDAFISEWLEDKPKDWVVEEAIQQRLPASPMGVTAREVLEDRHLAQREFFIEVEHPEAGKLNYPSAPYKFSATDVSTLRPAPLLGQHNEDTYSGRLGYSKGELALLRRSSAI